MRFFQRIGNALQSRAGACVFFALAAAAFFFLRGSSWAYGWIAQLYPLGEAFVPALFALIGVCAATILCFLLLPETIKTRALRVIYTIACALACIAFGYTAVLLFGLDQGIRPGSISNGLGYLRPGLPYLLAVACPPLLYALFPTLRKSRRARICAAAAAAGVLLLSGLWGLNQLLLIHARNVLNTITVEAGDTELALPKAPFGVTVTYSGTDSEQVVDANRRIHTPVADTVIAAAFRLRAFGSAKITHHEVTITMPGKNETARSVNPKPRVLPELRQWFGHEGEFSVSAASKIWLDPALGPAYRDMAARFAEDYFELTGNAIEVAVGVAPAAGDFYFQPSGEPLGKETYDMAIADHLTILSSHHVGAHWATRTILQILKQSGAVIPKGLVRDYPKYELRGFCLDAGRKAIPLDFLRMWVKQMSWYKLNDFSVHLSDECFDLNYWGFRLESGVPGLTSTDVFYTKDEFRAFIAEAAAQGVNIVPELDTPGHARAYTNARPELARPGNINYLDVENPAALAFVKEIFAEYLEGDNPVFPEGTVVHIGTDEYKGGGKAEKEAFRAYQDQLLRFIRDDMGRTPRVWGSQTENEGKTPVTVEGVQLHMWNAGYADPKKMYELGYQMINIDGDYTYIVPGADYYYDYLDKNKILNEWQPNHMPGLRLPAGDPQVLGGSYALWNDKTGEIDNGTSDVEMFDRMFDILPTFSQRLWSDCRDYDVAAIDALSETTKYAPGTNPVYDVPEGYRFDKTVELRGGESYIETPVGNIGVGSTLEFRVRRAAESGDSPQVLFESDSGQILAVQKGTGKLGFSRDFREFSFDYVLPKGEWVDIRLETELGRTTLYVNGKKLQSLGRSEQGGGKWASLVIPMRRIGSETDAFVGEIGNIVCLPKQQKK